MNREEVKEVFQVIASVYPTFMPDTKEMLKKKVDTWAWAMKDMDYERVMAKTHEHIQSNKFPPTIAEISAFAPPKNEHLEKVRQWEKEAAQVPDHVKQEFKRNLEKLIKDKSK